MTEIGGSMGPLYGVMFSGLADALNGVEEIDAPVFERMLRNGLKEVQSIGDAKVGDKTLVDAYAPALEAFATATAKGESFAAALDALILAAETGRDGTIDLVAKSVGRAAWGSASRGVLDPGATSCAIILRALAEGAKAKVEGACIDKERDRPSSHAAAAERAPVWFPVRSVHGQSSRGAAMKIALGADSVGKTLLEVILAHLAKRQDLTVSDLSGDRFYAEVAEKVGKAVIAGEYDRGILFCGTGIGVSISANKVPGIRAALTPRRLLCRARGEIQQRSNHHHGLTGRRPRTGEIHRRRLAWLRLRPEGSVGGERCGDRAPRRRHAGPVSCHRSRRGATKFWRARLRAGKEGMEISGRAGCPIGGLGCGQPAQIERDESARRLRGRSPISAGAAAAWPLPRRVLSVIIGEGEIRSSVRSRSALSESHRSDAVRFGDDPYVWASWLYYQEGMTQNDRPDHGDIARHRDHVPQRGSRARDRQHFDRAGAAGLSRPWPSH